jgi:hypothetical protein
MSYSCPYTTSGSSHRRPKNLSFKKNFHGQNSEIEPRTLMISSQLHYQLFMGLMFHLFIYLFIYERWCRNT